MPLARVERLSESQIDDLCELYCLPELVPFYRKWGFTEELGGLRFMCRSR